jgi:hypothetical protein
MPAVGSSDALNVLYETRHGLRSIKAEWSALCVASVYVRLPIKADLNPQTCSAKMHPRVCLSQDHGWGGEECNVSSASVADT